MGTFPDTWPSHDDYDEPELLRIPQIEATLESLAEGQLALAEVLNEVGESLIVVMQTIGVVIENQRAAAEIDSMYRLKIGAN